jgi:hypothetical protein
MLNLLNEGKTGCKTYYKTIPKIQQNQPESKKWKTPLKASAEAGLKCC